MELIPHTEITHRAAHATSMNATLQLLEDQAQTERVLRKQLADAATERSILLSWKSTHENTLPPLARVSLDRILVTATVELPIPLESAEADAWDLGEEHLSDQHHAGVSCHPHTDCDPHSDQLLRAAFAAGLRHEDDYLMTWGQFCPTGHLGNPFRYPPRPPYSAAEKEAVLALHADGIGTRRIAGALAIKRPLVQQIIRESTPDAAAE